MWSDRIALALALAFCLLAGQTQADSPNFGFGRPPTEAEIAAWDIDVRADGKGLPPGHGSVAEGARLFVEHCQVCHLDGGAKALAPGLDILVGRKDALTADNPAKTIGNYWPFATTLFDFIRRAMPLPAPQSLKPDEVYALSAFLLNRDGFIDRDDWRDPPAASAHGESR